MYKNCNICDRWFQIWRPCEGRDDFGPSLLISFAAKVGPTLGTYLGRSYLGKTKSKFKTINRHGPRTAANLISAVTHIQIINIFYCSTLVQTNVSLLQSFRDQHERLTPGRDWLVRNWTWLISSGSESYVLVQCRDSKSVIWNRLFKFSNQVKVQNSALSTDSSKSIWRFVF